jgi:hypothetical protein
MTTVGYRPVKINLKIFCIPPFFHYFCKRIQKVIIMNTTPHTSETPGNPSEAVMSCVSSWPCLKSGIHYNYLVDYHSYNGFGTYNLSPEEWDNREMIYNFKNNSELTDPISHRQAMTKAIELLLPLLERTFGDRLPLLTLVCIPASTAEKTAARFDEFSQQVCTSTGMGNAYSHIHVVVDGESKHLGDSHLPQYSLDEDFFKDRLVLLFDDIMSTGGSISAFAEQMSSTGAKVVAAVVLGKTVGRHKD